MTAHPEKPDRRSIRIFAAFLDKIGRPGCDTLSWPEDDADGEIDAIIGGYALQHTSIDTLPEGRKRDVSFGTVVRGIEAEFRAKLGYSLIITLHWASVRKGQHWPSLNAALRSWIVNDAPTLSNGRHKLSGIAGVPFDFEVRKGEPPMIDGVAFTRNAPVDHTLGSRLRDQISGARHDKLTVLQRYRQHGKATILLLESADIALMNDSVMAEAFEEAFPAWPEALDELWFVHHAAPPTINVHDLRLGQSWIYNPQNSSIVLHNGNTRRVTLEAG